MTLEKAKKIIKSECYIADLLNLDRTRMVNTALDTVIEAAEQTRWIPVTERLPDTFGGDYLVTIEHKGEVEGVDQATYSTLGYIDGLWETVNDWIEGPSEDWHVIAWMPLPHPYKAEGSEN
jgi:hypothetical protein